MEFPLSGRTSGSNTYSNNINKRRFTRILKAHKRQLHL